MLLALAGLILLLLLVLELAEVHDAAHGGPLVRRDLDEIQLFVPSQSERGLRFQ